MPYATHYLLTWGGRFGYAGEIWSNGIRLASEADLDADPDETAALVGYKAAVKALVERPSTKIGFMAKVDYLKFNKIGPDGRYVSSTESNTLFLNGPDVITGGASGVIHPYSMAVCVTWLTDFARGRGSKGRIYSPNPALTLTDDGHMAAADVAGIAQSYSQFITAVNAVNPAPGDALQAVVASSINGALNPIRTVSVGSVPDTMRSRRNQLTEVRSTSAVA